MLPNDGAFPSLGSLLAGRYRLEQRVGRGGMADVFRAGDELLHRSVAIKLFRIDAVDDVDRPRIDAEMRTLAALRHPALVTLFDAGAGDGSSGGAPYLVMEYIAGDTLRSRIGTGPLPAAEAAALGHDLAAALRYVHANGVVHRDIKPANILLDDAHGSTTAKLTDFGIAQVADTTRHTMQGTTVGTANYLSPEQAQGSRVTAASDVYSLGLVLIECLTGRLAYPGSGIEAALARLHRAPEVPHLPDPRWHELLTGMTALHPQDRPDVERVVRTLAELAGRPAVPVEDVSTAAAMPVPPGADPTPALSATPPPGGTAPLGPAAISDTAALGPATAGDTVALGRSADPPRGSRRTLLALGALAVVLVAAVVIALVATGSGGDGQPAAAPSSSAPATGPAPSSASSRASSSPTPSYADVDGRLGQDLRAAEALVAADGPGLGALQTDLTTLARAAANGRYGTARAALSDFEADAAAARAAGSITDAQLARLRSAAADLSADLRSASGNGEPSTTAPGTVVRTRTVQASNGPANGPGGPSGGTPPGDAGGGKTKTKTPPGQQKTKDKGPGGPGKP